MSTFTNTAREVEMPNGDVVVIHNAPTGGENTTSNIKKFKYDDNGHVTESTAADAEDLNLSSYSTPTTGTTAIGTSDDVQTAIGKLDHQSHIDQTNIWSVQNKIGKNRLNFKAWSEAVPLNKGTKTVSDNAITLTATDNDCYTKYGSSEYPQDVRIKVNPGDVISLSWDYSAGSGQSDDKVYIFGYNETEPPLSNANVSAQTGYLQYTAPANAKFCTFRLGVATSGNTATYSNIMICDKAIYDQDSSYQPYGAPNYDLTQLEQQDRNALVEVVDEGAKNVFDLYHDPNRYPNPITATGLTATIQPDGTVSVTGTPTTAEYTTLRLLDMPASYFRKFNGYYLSGSVAPSGKVTKTQMMFELASSPYTKYGKSEDGNPDVAPLDFPDSSSLVYFFIRIYNADTTTPVNLTFKPMLTTKAKLDVSPNYAPYALPNTDLTVLQAEDRAALVDVVDSGAKNLLDWANSEIATYNPYHATVSKTNSSFTITSTDVSASYGFVKALPKGKYVLTTTISNFSGSNICQCVISVGSRSDNIVSRYTFTGNCNIELRFELTQISDVYINYYANVPGNPYVDVTSYTASNIMICTKAAFDVSPAYVPFTLKQPRVIFKNFSGTVSNTEAVIPDLSLTVNKTSLIRVSITATYNANSPRLLRVAANNDMTGNSTIEVKEINSDQGQLSVVAIGIFYANSNNTVYISAKYSGTGTNSVKAIYEIFEV